MPGKRSRLTHSQSFSDIGFGNHRHSPRDTGFVADDMDDQSLQSVITISPPPPLLPEKEKDRGGESVKTGHFLERCGFCKKRLNQKQDFFMYGYLGAFCSSECRDAQIATDKAGQEVCGQSIGTKT